eukprot:3087904-Pyramimonas_sp.AAC.1
MALAPRNPLRHWKTKLARTRSKRNNYRRVIGLLAQGGRTGNSSQILGTRQTRHPPCVWASPIA